MANTFHPTSLVRNTPTVHADCPGANTFDSTNTSLSALAEAAPNVAIARARLATKHSLFIDASSSSSKVLGARSPWDRIGARRIHTEWRARTDGNTIAVFADPTRKVGDFCNVRITEATPHTLIGVAA
jgi:hypothetical protein